MDVIFGTQQKIETNGVACQALPPLIFTGFKGDHSQYLHTRGGESLGTRVARDDSVPHYIN